MTHKSIRVGSWATSAPYCVGYITVLHNLTASSWLSVPCRLMVPPKSAWQFLNYPPKIFKIWCGTFLAYKPQFKIFLLGKDQAKFFWGFSYKKFCLRVCKNFVRNPAQNFWNFSLSAKSQKWTDLMTWNLAWVLSLVQAFMPTSRSKFWTKKIPGFLALNRYLSNFDVVRFSRVWI